MTNQGDTQRNFLRAGNDTDRSQWRSGDAEQHVSRRQSAKGGSMMIMPKGIATGQSWSVWTAERRQWLDAQVVHAENGTATLQLDHRYGISAGHDRLFADTEAMMRSGSLFRYIES